MGGLMPKAPGLPAAPPPAPQLAQTTAAQADVTKAGEAAAGTFGAAGTVLTGPQGLTMAPTTANKSLLGT